MIEKLNSLEQDKQTSFNTVRNSIVNEIFLSEKQFSDEDLHLNLQNTR